MKMCLRQITEGSNILCRFAGIDRPELSSSTDTLPAMKRECHSKTALRLKECSPKASRSISRVSVADLPSFTQNLVQTRCSIFPPIAERRNTKSKKNTRTETMRVHSAVSYGGLMQ
jgi:hypothetical protein